jgi:VanZ family protein
MKKRLLLAPVAVITVATGLAYMNGIPNGWFQAPWDKIAHLTLYGWLAAAMAVVLPRDWRQGALWIPMLFGVADEWAQSFSRNRSSDVLDFLADATGIVLAYLLVRSGRILHFVQTR